MFICDGKAQNTFSPQHIPAGLTDESYEAPKTVNSQNIVYFYTHFCSRWSVNGKYWEYYNFECDLDENGLFLSEVGAINFKTPVERSILDEIYQVLVIYNLFGYNGTDKVVTSLPAECQACSLKAEFDSGETLYFRFNGNPILPWAEELMKIFAREFAKAGQTKLGEVILGKPTESSQTQQNNYIPKATCDPGFGPPPTNDPVSKG